MRRPRARIPRVSTGHGRRLLSTPGGGCTVGNCTGQRCTGASPVLQHAQGAPSLHKLHTRPSGGRHSPERICLAQVGIARGRSAATLVDCPHHERLPPSAIARREDALGRRFIVLGVRLGVVARVCVRGGRRAQHGRGEGRGGVAAVRGVAAAGG
eukprot:570576-Prymnesium_polylepis.2